MKLPDYSKCQMYKIVCNDINIKDCYVGHTCNWIQRKKVHKHSINYEKSNEYNGNKATFIRENGGWDNWCMILIENYPCETKLNAEQRERYWFEILEANLNSKRPHVTNMEKKNEKIIYDKQYRIDNNENKKKIDKNYFEINKKIIINCECGYITNKFEFSRHKRSKIHQNYIISLHTLM